ncbi:hypothetical protein ACUC2M_17690 [Bacillus cytotoxicus]
MEEIVTPDHWKLANEIRKTLSIYKENELYFKLGTIQENEENAYIFECKNKIDGINTFLKQGRTDCYHFEDIVQAMHHIV